MINYHIVTGDELAGTFRRTGIEGSIIVSRECLIDGPVSDEDESAFWNKRAEFVERSFAASPAEYFQQVKSEFDKIAEIRPEDEVNLWFEHDLFCQTNMWFVVSLLVQRGITRVFRINPLVRNNAKWNGFRGHTSNDLIHCFEKRALFTKGDFTLGVNLWDAYRRADVVALAFYSRSLSPCFPFLEDVCRAEAERKRRDRPKKVLEDLLSQGYTEFGDIFSQFTQTEGIYGFGDMQVSNMLKELRP